MQFLDSPSGDVVAVMEVREALILDVALSRYLLQVPDSRLAARMLAAVSRANGQRERRQGEAAERDAHG